MHIYIFSLQFQFDKELHKRWDAAMDAGAFRYGIDHILTRIIPGPKAYVGQVC